MEEKKLADAAGGLSLTASIGLVVVFGLIFLGLAGYVLYIMVVVGALVGALSGGTANAGGEIAGATTELILVLGAIFLPGLIVGILGCIFGKKTKKLATDRRGTFYKKKGKLITYDVFTYIFAIFAIGCSMAFLFGGILTADKDVNFTTGVISKAPFLLLLVGIMYLVSAILLSVEIGKNAKNFKAMKEGTLVIEVPTPVAPIPVMPTAPSSPQIITLKEGEEIPEHLKGRLVPVTKPVEQPETTEKPAEKPEAEEKPEEQPKEEKPAKASKKTTTKKEK